MIQSFNSITTNHPKPFYETYSFFSLLGDAVEYLTQLKLINLKLTVSSMMMMKLTVSRKIVLKLANSSSSSTQRNQSFCVLLTDWHSESSHLLRPESSC